MAPPTRTRSVVVWNVQRLLHPKGSPLSRALDATETHGWTRAAYTDKVARVAAVLRDACGSEPPALLGLVEVENAAVVRDVLRATGWSSLVDVAVEGEMLAGYDIALAYDADALKPAGPARSFNVHNRYSTRDVLDVPLKTKGGAPLTVILNHWPSRKLSSAEALRIGAADHVTRLVEGHLKLAKEDLTSRRGLAKLPARAALEEKWLHPLLVLGDFNDTPYDASLRLLAESTRERAEVLKRPRFPAGTGPAAVASYLAMRPRLYNPSWGLLGTHLGEGAGGTYRYGRDWYLLDQMLCSQGLLVGEGRPRFVEDSLRVHAAGSVVVNGRRVDVCAKNGEPLPYDAKQRVGVSDHFPLVGALELPG